MAQFTYGNYFSYSKTDFSNASLVLKQWAVDVLRYGRPLLVFSDFLNTRTELGRGKGDTIYVPIYGEVESLGTSPLQDGTSIPTATVSLDSVSVTIDEYGNAVTKPANIDYFNNLNNQAELLDSLSFNYAKSWDAVSKSVFEKGAHGLQWVGTTGSWTIGSNISGATPQGTLDSDIIDAVYDHLKSNEVLPFPDGYYRWVLNTVQARQVKNTPEWQELQKYQPATQGMGFIKQELGPYKGFVWIEANGNMDMSIGEGYAFGMNVGAQAFGLPMDVRYEPDFKQDFQRMQAFAWYLIGGVAPALRDKGTTLLVVKTKKV